MRDLTIPGYSIQLARSEHILALPAIELEAAQMLRGHAPESVLAENTDESTFADAAHDGRLWVASTGNIPVGFALVKMLADDLPHLEEIDVDPSHGRRGLGTALVRAVCDWAALSGYIMLTLTTFRAVPWNLPFYARLGFEEIPRETLRPELAAVVSEEAHRGLDPNTRAVMGYRCGPTLIRGMTSAGPFPVIASYCS
jgi:GNAT superfamily N-acetyltransferase